MDTQWDMLIGYNSEKKCPVLQGVITIDAKEYVLETVLANPHFITQRNRATRSVIPCMDDEKKMIMGFWDELFQQHKDSFLTLTPSDPMVDSDIIPDTNQNEIIEELQTALKQTKAELAACNNYSALIDTLQSYRTYFRDHNLSVPELPASPQGFVDLSQSPDGITIDNPQSTPPVETPSHPYDELYIDQRVVQLEKDNARLSANLHALEQQHHNQAAEQAQNQSLKSMQQQLTELQARYTALQAEVEPKTQRLAELEDTVVSQNTELEDLQRAHDEEVANNESRASRLATLEQTLVQREHDIEMREEALAERQKELEAVQDTSPPASDPAAEEGEEGEAIAPRHTPPNNLLQAASGSYRPPVSGMVSGVVNTSLSDGVQVPSQDTEECLNAEDTASLKVPESLSVTNNAKHDFETLPYLGRGTVPDTLGKWLRNAAWIMLRNVDIMPSHEEASSKPNPTNFLERTIYDHLLQCVQSLSQVTDADSTYGATMLTNGLSRAQDIIVQGDMTDRRNMWLDGSIGPALFYTCASTMFTTVQKHAVVEEVRHDP